MSSKLPADQTAFHRLKIGGIFRGKMSARDRKISVWNYIVANEIKLGTQFLVTKPERNLFVVLGATSEILPMPKAGRGGDRIFSYIHQMYGLSEREDTTKVVYDVMRSYAIQHGTHVELRRFAAYDASTQTCYLSTYDGCQWRLDGTDKIAKIPTGDEGIFFIDDDGGEPIVPDIGPHGLILDHLTGLNFADQGLGGITSEQQRKALIIWLFALALPDLMPTKPLLMIEGAMGSGKSLAAQLVQVALMGAVKPITISRSQEDEFGVLLLRSPICVLDNVDSYIDWVADKVCSYTTTGVFPKRKLYSDDEEVIIKPHAFLAVASKNPTSFRREDVADRCIVLRLERRTSFRRAEKIIQDTKDLRAKLFGEYLYLVNQIIKEIRAGAYSEDEQEAHRMADYAALGRVVAKVVDWEPDEVVKLMNALQSERDAFISEEDPLVELLHTWIAYQPRMGPRNVGREVSVQQLFQELDSFAQAAGIQWYKSPRMLVQKLRSTHVDRDFIVQTSATDGRKSYRIWRKSDPQLTLVEHEESDPPIEVG